MGSKDQVRYNEMIILRPAPKKMRPPPLLCSLQHYLYNSGRSIVLQYHVATKAEASKAPPDAQDSLVREIGFVRAKMGSTQGVVYGAFDTSLGRESTSSWLLLLISMQLQLITIIKVPLTSLVTLRSSIIFTEPASLQQ